MLVNWIRFEIPRTPTGASSSLRLGSRACPSGTHTASAKTCQYALRVEPYLADVRRRLGNADQGQRLLPGIPVRDRFARRSTAVRTPARKDGSNSRKIRARCVPSAAFEPTDACSPKRPKKLSVRLRAAEGIRHDGSPENNCAECSLGGLVTNV
jgi:hypothetical protein